MRARLRSVLSHRLFPLALAVFAALISLPLVGVGFLLDDYVLRAVSLGRGREVALTGSPFDLFSFFSDAPSEHLRQVDAGWAPWWSSAELHQRFFRPLSSLSHWLDFQVWGSAPLPMHLENVALYACLVLTVAVFYRRLMGPPWIAGLAAVFYAFEPGQALSVGMISGRNSVLAPLFGVLALIAHDRARRDGWKPGVPLAAALFAASLLSGESGVSTGLYVFAYAICLDPAPAWARRLRALAPCALVGLAWLIAYQLLHYGARGNAMYTDPVHDPGVFLRDAIVRAPIFLHSLLGLPTASLFWVLSASAIVGLAVLGALFCALFARLSWPVLREDPVARFFALGMVLSVLPICATIPFDRLLIFVGLGGLGLVARFIAAALGAPARAPRALAWFLLVVHGPLAVVFNVLSIQAAPYLAGVSRELLDEILLEPAVSRQTVVFVNLPAQYFSSHLAAMRLGTTRPIPLRRRDLAPGIYPLTLTRLDARSLTVRAEGGLLQPLGRWNLEGQERSTTLNPIHESQYFSQYTRRADDPMRAGDTLALTGMTIEVRQVTPDGRPVEVLFTFDEPLESPTLRWLAWDRGRYVDFSIPPIGETVKLAPVGLMPR